MEYVEGESLATLIRCRELPWPIGARIVADALAGLHAAHELRSSSGELVHLVHRDLSPSNVLIGYDGSVKVVDFGVARARGLLHTTDVGMLKGKFAYMSPEQARNRPVDRRSDIFAAGILLYEVTTRRRLFRASTDTASLELVLKSKIPPPSSVVPGYPRRLEAVVLKALQRVPRKRFATAREMQVAVEECIFASGSPVLQATVGDLMKEAFAEDIKAKRRLRRRSLLDASSVPSYQGRSTLPSIPSARPPTVVGRRRAGEDLPSAADPDYDSEETPVVNILPEQLESMRLEWEVARLSEGSGATREVVETDGPWRAGSFSRETGEDEASAPDLLVSPGVVIEIEEAAFERPVDPTGRPVPPTMAVESDSQVVTAASPPTFASNTVGPRLLSARRRHGRLYGIALLGGLVLAALILVVGRRGTLPEATAPPWRGPEEELLITASPRAAVLYVEGRRVNNPYRLQRSGARPEVKVRVEAAGYESRELRLSTAQPGGLVITLRPAARLDAGPRTHRGGQRGSRLEVTPHP